MKNKSYNPTAVITPRQQDETPSRKAFMTRLMHHAILTIICTDKIMAFS